jgi:hypothetical protein
MPDNKLAFNQIINPKFNNKYGKIEMKGITRCKLTIISESAACKKFLGQIVSYPASL